MNANRFSRNINDVDVICGRGGRANSHKGNVFFHEIVANHKSKYLVSSKPEKKLIAKFIVDVIRRRGGRFLKCDEPGEFIDIGDIAATEKTCQALREGLSVRKMKDKAMKKDTSAPYSVAGFSSCNNQDPVLNVINNYKVPCLFPIDQSNNYFTQAPDHNVIGQSYNNNHGRFEPIHVTSFYDNYQQIIRHGQDYAQTQAYSIPDINQNPKLNNVSEYIGRCTCKKSNCLKLYCQCFAKSIYCSSSDCRCSGCYNVMYYDEMIHTAKAKITEKNRSVKPTKNRPDI